MLGVQYAANAIFFVAANVFTKNNVMALSCDGHDDEQVQREVFPFVHGVSSPVHFASILLLSHCPSVPVPLFFLLPSPSLCSLALSVCRSLRLSPSVILGLQVFNTFASPKLGQTRR